MPQKYFDRFPLDEIELPDILEGDAEDTFKHTIDPGEDDRSGDRGTEMYHSLVASFEGDRELALKKFIQAYLASVASVDDLLGEILEVVDESPLRDNTIVVFTSDHGWGMGEKDYLYKNSLWQESTRVPLVIRAPGVAKAGATSDVPVGLIDLYPTLVDLCGLPYETRKNDKGHPLDGFSLRPLLADPAAATWAGPDAVLTALYQWARHYDPAEQSYSLRSRHWRYIRYGNGNEELYHAAEDPHEWTNLAGDPKHTKTLNSFREQLLALLPEPQPEPKLTAAQWKDRYFTKHPDADENGDGTLTWPEYRAHREAAATKPKTGNGRLQTSGIFSRNEAGHLVFTDGKDRRTYYVIDVLADQVAPQLESEVSVIARVKPTDSGKGC